MNSQSGFTLIEVMVAGLISAILAATVLSSLYMTGTQIRDGIGSQRLTQFQIVVSEQIRQKARQAYAIKISTDGAGALTGALGDPALTGITEAVFCNQAGDTLAGYKIHFNPGYLMEWKSGIGFLPFRIGQDSVAINSGTSFFGVLPRRRGITFTLEYEHSVASTIYTFPPIKETVICRNNTL